jgi:hypothetical protein
LSSPSDADKIASFHQPIAPNGLYWTAPVPESGVEISNGGRTISVTVAHYAVIDQPSFPKPGPEYAASLDFTLRWTAIGERIAYSQPKGRYRLDFRHARCQVAYTARIPSRGIVITSDPLESSDSVFAMMGTEHNGSFY